MKTYPYMPDCDLELPCGCTVAIDHGEYDWELSSSDDCTEGHSRYEALDILKAEGTL